MHFQPPLPTQQMGHLLSREAPLLPPGWLQLHPEARHLTPHGVMLGWQLWNQLETQKNTGSLQPDPTAASPEPMLQSSGASCAP